MKAYRLTDLQSIENTLKRASSVTGESGGSPVNITGIESDDTVNEHILIRTDAPAIDTILIPFKQNRVTIRVEELEPNFYSVKDLVIESAERTSERTTELDNRVVHNVLIHPPVDVASSVALYGKTPVIAQACQMMRMMLEGHLNANGYMLSEVDISFSYSSDNPIHMSLEAARKSFYVVDVLSREICTLADFINPLADDDTQDPAATFDRYTRKKIRSRFVFPFSDPQGNVMGFITLDSTMKGLGHRSLSEANRNPAAMKLFLNFLRDKAEDLVFQMEVGLIRQWIQASNKEVILDMSQNARGCQITLHADLPEKVLKRGSKIQFQIDIGGGQPGTFLGTVRNIRKKENHTALGLRINKAEEKGAMEALANLAAEAKPDI